MLFGLMTTFCLEFFKPFITKLAFILSIINVISLNLLKKTFWERLREVDRLSLRWWYFILRISCWNSVVWKNLFFLLKKLVIRTSFFFFSFDNLRTSNKTFCYVLLLILSFILINLICKLRILKNRIYNIIIFLFTYKSFSKSMIIILKINWKKLWLSSFWLWNRTTDLLKDILTLKHKVTNI